MDDVAQPDEAIADAERSGAALIVAVLECTGPDRARHSLGPVTVHGADLDIEMGKLGGGAEIADRDQELGVTVVDGKPP